MTQEEQDDVQRFLANNPFEPCFEVRIEGEPYYVTIHGLEEFERGGEPMPPSIIRALV